MKINATTKLCLIIGDPVEDSLSPQIHNAGYEQLGLEAAFVYAACRIKSEELAAFVGGAKAMAIRGFGCKMPHKLEIMRYLDEIDPIARQIGAVNTVVNDNGKLKGYNTDHIGIIAPLEAVTGLKGKKVALLGAGGAARAAAYGLTSRGAELTIYNRTLEKAEQLAGRFGATARSFDALQEVKAAAIIVNTTSVGLPLAANETPLPQELISKDQIVFDAVYAQGETRLSREAREQGATVILGTEMLLYQGLAQFKLFTGHEAPEDAMRKALLVAMNDEGNES
ncbi:MAG TPA: shikimate dehydrogenase [Candidatus Saccharimonadales bacterium]